MTDFPLPFNYDKQATAISSVAVFGKDLKAERSESVSKVIATFRSLGVEVYVESGFAQLMEQQVGSAVCAQIQRFDTCPSCVEMAISMGGDGTFLSTAAKLGQHQVPILGVNTGRLGFLADVTPDRIETALRQIVKGHYNISARTLIAVEVVGGRTDTYPFALNEVAVLKHDNSSLIEVETHVDGQLLTNYLADGLIVSTPTGSTGYALSVGGPVLAPESPTFCVAPVAPHSLTMRPVILSDEGVISLRVKSRSGHFLLAIDGRSKSFAEGSVITLRKAGYKVMVVKTEGNDFFNTLRNKMMWGLDQRNG